MTTVASCHSQSSQWLTVNQIMSSHLISQLCCLIYFYLAQKKFTHRTVVTAVKSYYKEQNRFCFHSSAAKLAILIWEVMKICSGHLMVSWGTATKSASHWFQPGSGMVAAWWKRNQKRHIMPFFWSRVEAFFWCLNEMFTQKHTFQIHSFKHFKVRYIHSRWLRTVWPFQFHPTLLSLQSGPLLKLVLQFCATHFDQQPLQHDGKLGGDKDGETG